MTATDDAERFAARGPHPVGVTTAEIDPPGRSAPIPVEIWYPATVDVAGRDTDPDAQDEYDLIPGIATGWQAAVRDAPAARLGSSAGVVFSHGMAGHRRQSTFLCTHLASHGLVVAAPDHVGNTLTEMMPFFFTGDYEGIEAAMIQSALDRPGDVVAVLDHLDARRGELGIGEGSFGISGHSFGGWTALQAVAGEPRIGSVVGLAAGGGRTGDDDRAADLLDLDWSRAVPTLLVAAELDTILPLAGMRDLFARIPGATLVVIQLADHYHFCDESGDQHELVRGMAMPGVEVMRPFAELVPSADAERLVRGLAARHFVRTLLDGQPPGGPDDVRAVVDAWGVAATVPPCPSDDPS
jgi:predicted dienelactone hydrolase